MTIGSKANGAMALLLMGIAGCSANSSGSAPPAVDPTAAAAKAIQEYDKNGDAKLSEAELAACPAILSIREQYDTDKDGQVSQAELEERLKQLYALPVSFVDVRCDVTSGGQPVTGAEVIFTPEPFLAESIQAATGITDSNGVAKPSVSKEYLPEKLQQMEMMQVGLYNVEIKSAGQPANGGKKFGFEVDPARRGGTTASFDLRAK